jgi:hypothetical protein
MEEDSKGKGKNGYRIKRITLVALAISACILIVAIWLRIRHRVDQHLQTVFLIDMIPPTLSGETQQDSEPFLAVDQKDPNLMVASAFTPSPDSQSHDAPLFFTVDGGKTWELSSDVIPSPGKADDITHAFGGQQGVLFGSVIRSDDRELLELISDNVKAHKAMTSQAHRRDEDQPFVSAATFGVTNRVYVGNNDLSQRESGRTATIDVSVNRGESYVPIRLEFRNSADVSACTPLKGLAQDGPSVRPAIANDGTVYVSYMGWRSFVGNCGAAVITSDVVVLRDDHGAISSEPFRDLKDPKDGKIGIRVAAGVTVPWSLVPTLGQERLGSTLSLAVDPNDSRTVYVAWGDRVGNGDVYTIHLRRSRDGAANWSPDLFSRRDAANVALSVADNGTVGILYQAHVGAGDGVWETHLAQTNRNFSTMQDTVLAITPSDPPSAPKVEQLPYLGDYLGLVAVKDEFRGVFSAANTPDPHHFPHGVLFQRLVDASSNTLTNGQGVPVTPSIDPFYFSVSVLR